MVLLLCVYVIASLVLLLPATSVYTLVQPALISLFFIASHLLTDERPFLQVF